MSSETRTPPGKPDWLPARIGWIPVIVSAIYATASTLWIIFSDRILLSLVDDLEHYRILQTWKGTAFIIGSAALIYVLLVYALGRVRAAYATLQASEERLRLALRCAGGGVWEMPLHSGLPRFTYVAPELLARLGLPTDRPPSRAELTALVHPDDLAAARTHLRALADGEGGVFESCTRLRAADGGTVWLEAHASVAPTPQGAPRRVVGVSLDVTRRVAAEERVGELLRYDAATGLAKAGKFVADLDARLAEAGPGAVVGVVQIRPCGLDAAATAGEDADIWLAIADALKPLRGSDHLLARLSTDTFALATPSVASARAAREQVGLVLDHLAAADPEASFAVGAAIFPDDGRSSQDLLAAGARALEALGPAMDTRVLWFTHGLDEQYRRHAALRRDLRRAVEADEILCHYQPLIDLASGRTAGFEALARWRRADGDLVPPGHFIPLAEASGDIRAIGEAVLRQACAAAATWGSGLTAPFVAVNVSPVQLADPRFPAQVARILAATGLAPQRLELEVTEGVFAGDQRAIAARLADLRALGVAIAIDDFGTGYSSLSLLARLPFTRLKVDRSFVADIAADTAVLQAIVTLGRRFGLATTAEGIETAEQLDRVAAFGIDVGQGFHFSRPVVASAVPDLVGATWRVPPETRDRADVA